MSINIRQTNMFKKKSINIRQKNMPKKKSINIRQKNMPKKRSKGFKNPKHCYEHRRCLVCGVQYGDQNLDAHMHSYVHKEAIERLKGSEQLHKCWACEVSVQGLEQYKEHIATEKHMYSLHKLHNKRQRCVPLQVDYNIDLTDKQIKALQKEQQKRKEKCSEDCFVCRKHFPVQDLDIHMHSIIHHQAIEKLKRSPQAHKCWACDMTKTGMAEYEQHVGTLYHEYMLFKLHNFTADGEKVDYSADIDDELRALCEQRDKQKEAQIKSKQKRILEMARSSEPLVKRLCLEKPSENLPKEMSDQGTLTREIEDGTSTGSTCGPGLVQSRMESNRPNLTAAIGAGSTEKAATENEAVVLHSKRTRARFKKWKAKTAAAIKLKRYKRKGMNGQEPYVDSLPSGTSLAEMFESQTSGSDCQTVELVENIQPHTVCVKKNKSKECDAEQGETSLKNSFGTDSCNIRKTNKQVPVISLELNPKTTGKTTRKRKVKKLFTLSTKEDELTSSLDNVGEELFEAYSTLQSAYTEVQRLLAVKQQVTSEMASLRAKRIKILHDMKNPTQSDQQVEVNPCDAHGAAAP